MADGIPDWLDEPAGVARTTTVKRLRVKRLRALGNAVVPQVCYPILVEIARLLAENGEKCPFLVENGG